MVLGSNHDFLRPKCGLIELPPSVNEHSHNLQLYINLLVFCSFRMADNIVERILLERNVDRNIIQRLIEQKVRDHCIIKCCCVKSVGTIFYVQSPIRTSIQRKIFSPFLLHYSLLDFVTYRYLLCA